MFKLSITAIIHWIVLIICELELYNNSFFEYLFKADVKNVLLICIKGIYATFSQWVNLRNVLVCTYCVVSVKYTWLNSVCTI